MPRQVRFFSHACIALEGEEETLLADPWLFGDVFNNSWTLHAPPDLNTIDFGRLRHIWLSHEHPDHMHIPSLRFIRERVEGPVTVYYRRQEDPAVRDRLAALGFKVVELAPHETMVIADDIAVTLFPTDMDSALVVRLGDRIIVNQNDCSLAEEETRTLTAMFPRIDAWFFQFSLGGYYANEDDAKGLQAAQEHHLELVRRYFAALRPALFVPFASFFYFSKEANAFLNDWCITPAELVARFPDLPVQVLWSGEALRWEHWQARNAVNLARWTEVLRGRRVIKPPAPFTESELLAAGRSFVRHAFACDLRLDGEMHLKIKETGRAAVIDWDNGTFAVADEADPSRLVLTAPAEELLYYFTSSHGDSIYYGSCFQVARNKGLNDLLRLRSKLRGLHARRILMLKWHVAQMDRNYLGGTVKSLYRSIRSHL